MFFKVSVQISTGLVYGIGEDAISVFSTGLVCRSSPRIVGQSNVYYGISMQVIT